MSGNKLVGVIAEKEIADLAASIDLSQLEKGVSVEDPDGAIGRAPPETSWLY